MSAIQQFPIAGYHGAQSPNSVSFQLQSITSRTIGGVTYQVCGHWATQQAGSEYSFAGSRMVLGVRTLPHGAWRWYVYNGVGGLPSIQLSTDDSHNEISLEIDSDGFVHVAYDHHVNALHYRRSSAALPSWTGGLTAELSMLGTNEASCSYPVFFRSPTGTLYFIMRMVGGSGNGNWFFFEYDESTTSWAACAGTGTAGLLFDGLATTPDWSFYPNGFPRFSSDWDGAGAGYMHIMGMWREGAASSTNQDMVHVRWDGANWTTMAGAAQTVPITQTNCAVVQGIPQSALMLNSPGFCLDANDRPHAAVIKSDGTQHQLYDLYYNDSTWSLQALTAYASANGIADYGRAWMECDTDTNEMFVWGTHTLEADGIIQWKSDPGDFTTWTKSTFYDAAIGLHEPTIDPHLWASSKFVCMFVTLGRDISAFPTTIRLVQRGPKGRTYAFDSGTWSRSHPITVDATKVGTGGVTSYTLRLTRDHFADEVCDPSSANNAQADGGDLRFFSDSGLTTQLACDVIAFDHDSTTAAGDAEVLVRVGPISLSDSTDTTIYVAYNASSTQHQPFVDETYGAHAAYDSGWLNYWPMATDMGDRVTLDNDDNLWATYGHQNPSADGTTFSGTGGVRQPAATKGIGAGFAMAARVTDSSASGNPQIISADDSSSNRGLQFRVETTGKASFIRFNSSNSVVTNLTGTSTVRGAGQKRLVGEYTGSASKLYVSGASEASDAVATAQHDDASLAWGIGQRRQNASLTSDYWTGNIADVEFHTSPRGDAWWLTDYNNTMSPATFAAAGAAGNIGAGATVSPATGTATWSGFAPSITQQLVVSPLTGAATWSGNVPTVTQQITVSPSTGSATWAGNTPTVSQAIETLVSPSAGAATWQGFTPTITRDTVIAPATGAATWQGFAPTISFAGDVTISPLSGAAAWQGFAPTVLQFESSSYDLRAMSLSGIPRSGVIRAHPRVTSP